MGSYGGYGSSYGSGYGGMSSYGSSYGSSYPTTAYGNRYGTSILHSGADTTKTAEKTGEIDPNNPNAAPGDRQKQE